MLNLPGCLKRSVPAIMCTDASLLNNTNLKEPWILSCVIPAFPVQFSKQLHILLLNTPWTFTSCALPSSCSVTPHCCLNLHNFWCNGILTPSPKLCVNTFSGQEWYLCRSLLLCVGESKSWRKEAASISPPLDLTLLCLVMLGKMDSPITLAQQQLNKDSFNQFVNSHLEPWQGSNRETRNFGGGDVSRKSLLPEVLTGTWKGVPSGANPWLSLTCCTMPWIRKGSSGFY